jgi:hypothetical protein
MGDLNIRYNKTGDKEPFDSVNKANKKALTKFLKSANYSILLDSNSTLNDNHWTFRFPGGGQSVPDYILYPTSQTKNIHNYKVNWATNCGSYHAMQTFNLKTNGQLKPNFWNTETFESTKWDDSNSDNFKSAINNYPLGDLTTKQNLEDEALKFFELIAKSKQQITKKSNKRKRPNAIVTKSETRMKQLLGIKPSTETLHNAGRRKTHQKRHLGKNTSYPKGNPKTSLNPILRSTQTTLEHSIQNR